MRGARIALVREVSNAEETRKVLLEMVQQARQGERPGVRPVLTHVPFPYLQPVAPAEFSIQLFTARRTGGTGNRRSRSIMRVVLWAREDESCC